MSSIQRREFIRLVAGGVTAWPLAARRADEVIE
jgi:hypothetical protein